MRCSIVALLLAVAGPVAVPAEAEPLVADGRFDESRPYAGGRPFVDPWGTVYSANLTSDPETGISKWSDDELDWAIVNGLKRGGGMLGPPMPWPYYAGRVTDADVRAIIAYLRTLRPIVNKVPALQPPASR